jgi:hypothetical protein
MTEENEEGEGRSKEANPDATQLEQVNRSGFPFQIAVEDEINLMRNMHEPWVVLGTEVPWQEGFIDIVFRTGEAIAVLECKRVESQDWIFLVPEGLERTIRTTWNFYDSRTEEPGKPGMYLGEFTMASDSYEASLCALSKKKSGNMTLEKICQELVRASQGIADFPALKRETEIEILIPILVTTARLVVCRYNARHVDPFDGIIYKGSAVFEEVPYIRFRKSFEALTEAKPDAPMSLGQLATRHQQTVLVCNGSHIKHLFLDVKRKITLHDGRYKQRRECE